MALIIKSKIDQTFGLGMTNLASVVDSAMQVANETLIVVWAAGPGTRGIRSMMDFLSKPQFLVLDYQRLFDYIQQSLDDGIFTNVPTIIINGKGKLMAETYAMKKAASELGMTVFKKGLEYRISLLLFPNLGKKLFAIRPADLAAGLSNEEVKKGSELFESIAKAIAGAQPSAIQEFLNKSVELKEAFKGYRKDRSAKRTNGDDILKFERLQDVHTCMESWLGTRRPQGGSS